MSSFTPSLAGRRESQHAGIAQQLLGRALTLLLLSRHVRSTEFEIWNVVSSYLFIPSMRPGGRIAPVLSLGWTLNYEMFFYFIFGLCLMFDRKRGTSLLITFFCGLAVISAISPFSFTPLRFWGDSIILEFLAGVALGMLRERGGLKTYLPVAIALFILGISALIAVADLNLPRALKGGIPATLLVYAALALPERIDRAIPDSMILLGDSSYALYLSHRFVLRGMTILFGMVAIPAQWDIFGYVAATLSGAIILSICVYRLIEVPMLRAFLGRSVSHSHTTAIARA